MNQVKMICVTANNNNKFYNMKDLDNGIFEVEYGRVGATSTKLSYPISDWNKKYNEKLKKGYVDISESLQKEMRKAELDIKDQDVKELITFLMNCAKQSIKSNYNISLDSITEIQINKVQNILNTLKLAINSKMPYTIINKYLTDIYTTIPRKMSDTRAFFMKANFQIQQLIELLQDEQNRLDTLRSQVEINNHNKINESITLESLGFSCEIASQEDRDIIAKETDFKVANQKIFKISNKETESNFNPNHLKTRLLYHGSKNENFLSILQNGLKIRPKGVATTGSMFGDGIYGADKARKSIGYTSLKGSYWASGNSNKAYLAIFEFATGKEYKCFANGNRWNSSMSNYNKEKINSYGYDSVFAEGGADLRNNEYIVYDSNQVTIRYLIELTN